MAGMKETATKLRYKVTSWSNYNQSLINRGDITLWLSDDFLTQNLGHTLFKNLKKPQKYPPHHLLPH